MELSYFLAIVALLDMSVDISFVSDGDEAVRVGACERVDSGVLGKMFLELHHVVKPGSALLLVTA